MRRLIAASLLCHAAARRSRGRPADPHPPRRHRRRRRPVRAHGARRGGQARRRAGARGWRRTCSSAWPGGRGSSRWPTRSSSSTRRARPSARSTRRPASSLVAPAISHSHAAVAAFAAQIAKQVGKPARDARIKITLRHIYRQRSRPGRGLDVAVAAQGDRRRHRRPRGPARAAPAADPPAGEGQRQRPGARLQHRHHDRQGALQAAPVQGPEVPQELRRRRRPAGLPDAERALRDPGQAGQPGVVGAQLAVGRRAAGHHRRGRQRRQPAQGALDGHRQRRRHPRHRRGLLDRHARRRTAASACTWPT